MRGRKSHISVVVVETISIVLSLAIIMFFLLTLFVSKDFTLFTGMFILPDLIMFIVWMSLIGLYVVLSGVVFLITLIGRNFVGLLYTLEFPVFGAIIGLGALPFLHLISGRYSGPSLIMAAVTFGLSAIVLLTTLLFLLFFFIDSIVVLKYKVKRNRERRAAKREEKAKDRVEITISVSNNEEAPKAEEVPAVEEAPTEEVVEEEEDEEVVAIPVEEKKAAPKEAKEEGDKPVARVYHISQHPTANKWQVKLAKGTKALKLFDTQAEAIAYAKEVCAKQGGSIRLHSKKGKMRSL